jgi:ferredoxin-NADP reductase
MSFKFSKQGTQGGEEPGNGKKSLEYTAGQYAYFDIGGVKDDPKGPIRHFTIASSPTEDFIMISTRIRDTPYKKRLSSLEEGVRTKVKGPQGRFVLHEDYSKPAVFLSGGIGVTPFRSMIKYATDKQLSVKILMFDSNRNQQSILYKKEFDEWANANRNLKIAYTITEDEDGTWKGERGRIDNGMLTKHLTSNDYDTNRSIFYVCGPPAMLNAMKKILEDDLNITKERIKVEEFTGY